MVSPVLRFQGFIAPWNISLLGSFLKHIGSGITPKGGSSVYQKEGVILIRSQNVHFSGLKLEDVAFISEEINERMKNSSVESFDVLLNITGGSIGRTTIVPLGFPKANVNQHVCILRTKKELFPQFLKSFMESSKGQKNVFTDQAGQTREAINLQQIKNFKIGIPTLEEQQKIASFFSILDKKIEKQHEKIEMMKLFNNGIMQKIFSKKFRFKDENGEDFAEWLETDLSHLLKIPKKIVESSISRDKLLTVKLHRNGVRVNQNTDTLKLGSTTYYRRKAGQFIFGKQNFFNGAFDIIPDKYDGYLSSGDVPTLEFNKDIIVPSFLIFYLGRESFYKKTEGIASGTGSKRIHESTLLRIKIKLPSLEEQQKISSFLQSISSKLEKEQAKLSSLNQLKKGLMHQMFV